MKESKENQFVLASREIKVGYHLGIYNCEEKQLGGFKKYIYA